MKKRYVVLTLVVGVFLVLGLSNYAFAEQKPKYGGIIRENSSKAPNRFGVPLNVRHGDMQVADIPLESLIRMTAVQDTYDPELAASWELAPDKSSYVFHLQKGVKFHDGTDFNAHAVKWNLDKVIASTRPMLKSVKSIDVIDDHTVRFNLKEWNVLILNDLVFDGTLIISPTTYEKMGEEWCNTHPVGTAPFKYKKYKRNSFIEWEKFDGYWKEGVPYLDGAIRYFVSDPMTSLALFKNKDIDIMPADVTTAKQLKEEEKYQMQWKGWIHQIVIFNSVGPASPWADKRMREALEYAIDKEAICSNMGKGFLEPVYEIVNNVPGNPKKTPRKYNPEKAKQLMREAGYPKGLKIKLVHGTGSNKDFYVAIQSYLSQVGIEVTLQALNRAAHMEKVFQVPQGNVLIADAQRGGMGTSLGSVKETLSSNSVFFPGIKRPDGFDSLINKAVMESNDGKRVSLLEQLDETGYGDAMFLPLWSTPHLAVYHPYVRNFERFIGHSPKEGWDYVWLDK